MVITRSHVVTMLKNELKGHTMI